MSGNLAPLLEDPAFFVSRPLIETKLAAWLAANPESPIAVLTGPPGTGKSRYAYHLSRRFPAFDPDGQSPALAAAILRDLRAGQAPDDFSWPILRGQLLALAGSGAIPAGAISAVVKQRTRDVSGVNVGVLSVQGMTTSIWELRQFVLPALEQLPAGPPLIVILDGLDEAERLSATDFLAAAELLTERVAESAGTDRGLGRLRVLLTSQPDTPIDLNPLRPPIRIDLGNIGRDSEATRSDENALRKHAHALLAALPDSGRDRVAELIAEQARGVWVIAAYAARSINDDVAEGRPVPVSVRLPADLAAVYTEAIGRIRARDSDNWSNAESLLALMAAAHEIDASLPSDVARAGLGVRANDMTRTLRCVRALVSDDRGDLRFFHGDFGQWIVNGGLSVIAVAEAHDRLAAALIDLTRDDWLAASRYAIENVSTHAFCAAEYGVDTIEFGRLRKRCLDLFTDRSRLAVDPNPFLWFQQCNRMAALLPAGACLPGTKEEFSGLFQRCEGELEQAVGVALAKPLLDEHGQDHLGSILETAVDDQSQKAMLQEYVPRYRETVREQSRVLLGRLLDGWRPATQSLALQAAARFKFSEWERTEQAALLDESIDDSERALAGASDSLLVRTSIAADLAGALATRSRTKTAHPGDMDRAIVLQTEVATNGGVADAPAAWTSLGDMLHQRWEASAPGSEARDSNSADDLTASIGAYAAAVKLTSDRHPNRAGRLVELGDALFEHISGGARQLEQVETAIDIFREIIARPDLTPMAPFWFRLGELLFLKWREYDQDAADLMGAFAAYQSAYDCEKDDRSRAIVLNVMSNLVDKGAAAGQLGSTEVESMLHVLRQTMAEPGLKDEPRMWNALGRVLARQAALVPEERADQLTAAAAAHRTALALERDGRDRVRYLMALANALAELFSSDLAQTSDLDEAIAVQRELAATPGLADPLANQIELSHILTVRWQRAPMDVIPLFAAVDAWREAQRQAEPDDQRLPIILGGLRVVLRARISTPSEQPDDLDTLISIDRTFVASASSQSRSGNSLGLASYLSLRWSRQPHTHAEDLSESIAVLQAALDAAEDGDVDRAKLAIRLASRQWEGFINKLTDADPDACVRLAIEVLDADPELAIRELPAGLLRTVRRRRSAG